jgi:hypothetical protein
MNRIDLNSPTAMEVDFALWAEQQGALLRPYTVAQVLDPSFYPGK